MTKFNFLFFISFFLLFSADLIAQKKFCITIKLSKNLQGKSLFITYDNGENSISKSVKIDKTVCIINGTFYSPIVKVNLRINDNLKHISKTSFFVTEDSSLIDISNSKSENLFEQGIYENVYDVDQEKRFYASFSEEFKEYSALYARFKKSNKIEKDSLKSLLREKKLTYFNKSYEYLLLYPTNYFSFYYLSKFIVQFDYISIDSLIAFYNQFPEHLRESTEGVLLKNKLFAKKNVILLKTVPGLAITLMNGEVYELKPNNRRITVLAFWASWCKPCIEELNELKKISQKYLDTSIAFIIVSLDKDTNACRKAIAKYQFNFLNSIDKDVVSKFGITYIPQCFLIDKSNRILYSYLENNDDSKLGILKQKIIESLY